MKKDHNSRREAQYGWKVLAAAVVVGAGAVALLAWKKRTANPDSVLELLDMADRFAEKLDRQIGQSVIAG
jgi:hypothetical protein